MFCLEEIDTLRSSSTNFQFLSAITAWLASLIDDSRLEAIECMEIDETCPVPGPGAESLPGLFSFPAPPPPPTPAPPALNAPLNWATRDRWWWPAGVAVGGTSSSDPSRTGKCDRGPWRTWAPRTASWAVEGRVARTSAVVRRGSSSDSDSAMASVGRDRSRLEQRSSPRRSLRQEQQRDVTGCPLIYFQKTEKDTHVAKRVYCTVFFSIAFNQE